MTYTIRAYQGECLICQLTGLSYEDALGEYEAGKADGLTVTVEAEG